MEEGKNEYEIIKESETEKIEHLNENKYKLARL